MDQLARLDICCADRKAHLTGVNAIEVDQPLECGLQRRDVIEAKLGEVNTREKGRRQHPGRKKLRDAEQHSAERTLQKTAQNGSIEPFLANRVFAVIYSNIFYTQCVLHSHKEYTAIFDSLTDTNDR